MNTYLPIPSPPGDAAHRRVEHGLLRFVREAAQSRMPLPGEIELTQRLHCTRQQLRKAMALLEAQGILRRRQGSVTTVDPVALRMSVRLEEQFEHAELLDRLGYVADVEVLDSRIQAVTAEVGAVMEIAPDTPALTVRKRWRADGTVAMIADDSSPLPPDAAKEFVHDPEESIFHAAARLWGEPVIWEVTTPGVCALSEELAALFERPVGTPIMTMEIIGIGASGQRLIHSTEYHHPDIVSYAVLRTVRPPWRGR